MQINPKVWMKMRMIIRRKQLNYRREKKEKTQLKEMHRLKYLRDEWRIIVKMMS